MKKIEKLQSENEEMKRILKEIKALVDMTDEEEKRFIKQNEKAEKYFYAVIAGKVNSILSNARFDGLQF